MPQIGWCFMSVSSTEFYLLNRKVSCIEIEGKSKWNDVVGCLIRRYIRVTLAPMVPLLQIRIQPLSRRCGGTRLCTSGTATFRGLRSSKQLKLGWLYDKLKENIELQAWKLIHCCSKEITWRIFQINLSNLVHCYCNLWLTTLYYNYYEIVEVL